MSWIVIRKATREDVTLLQKRAIAFHKRHNLYEWDNRDVFDHIDAVVDVEWNLSLMKENEDPEYSYLHNLWLRIVRRALKSPAAEGIAYGHVGFQIN